MKLILLLLLLVAGTPADAQTSAVGADPFQAVAFLQGTWTANAQGPSGVKALGTYSFGPELRGHVYARHSTNPAACKGPQDFDCQHSDLLYIFQDAQGQPLRAIYFDNEGHTLHYEVTTPSAGSVVFLSEASQPGPRFRLMYSLADGVMSGKFQMQMPGASEWHSYLEWSGRKQ